MCNPIILNVFNEDKVILSCGLLPNSEDLERAKKDKQSIEEVGMDEVEVASHNAMFQSCVRRRKELVKIEDTAMWIGTDEIASHLKLLGPPSLDGIIKALKEDGERVAPGTGARPGIITSAPWRKIVVNARDISPK